MFFLSLLSLVYANSNYEQGVAYMGEKNYTQASQSFQKCIDDEAQNTSCHWEIGWAYWMLSDWKKVVEHWTIVTKLNPKQELVFPSRPFFSRDFAVSMKISRFFEIFVDYFAICHDCQ